MHAGWLALWGALYRGVAAGGRRPPPPRAVSARRRRPPAALRHAAFAATGVAGQRGRGVQRYRGRRRGTRTAVRDSQCERPDAGAWRWARGTQQGGARRAASALSCVLSIAGLGAPSRGRGRRPQCYRRAVGDPSGAHAAAAEPEAPSAGAAASSAASTISAWRWPLHAGQVGSEGGKGFAERLAVQPRPLLTIRPPPSPCRRRADVTSRQPAAPTSQPASARALAHLSSAAVEMEAAGAAAGTGATPSAAG